MKVNTASNILKILLIVFSICVIFFGSYILPLMAEEAMHHDPELEYAKLPILIACELLLALLLTGVGTIMYLLVLFDRDFTFTSKFTRGLEILVGMCILASISIIVLFQYMTHFGGPGPVISIGMAGVSFLIWIVATVTMLVRAIVKKSMVYKNDYDLTV